MRTLKCLSLLMILMTMGYISVSAAPAVSPIPVAYRTAPVATPTPVVIKAPAEAKKVQAVATSPSVVKTPNTPKASQANLTQSGPEFSLTFDAVGQGLINLTPPTVYPGVGGNLFADWRPFSFISFGAGAGFTQFFGNDSFNYYYLSTFDLGGRLFPFGNSDDGEWYLQGGLGLRLLILTYDPSGHYHGYAGLGYRKFLGGNLALDLGAQYDFYSPLANPTHAATVKIGLAFLFGRTDWREPETQNENKGPEARESDWVSSKPRSTDYVWRVGDNLKKVAAKLYGNPALYAFLLDANQEILAHPASLRAGVKLRVPRISSDYKTESNFRVFSADARYSVAEQSIQSASQRELQKITARYVWGKNDNLKAAAQNVYGDESLYPLLVDANEGRLILPANLVPGYRLVVPPAPVSDEERDAIHEEAWGNNHYILWRNVTNRSGH